jgi:molybdopterin synthase catalytic subunit
MVSHRREGAVVSFVAADRDHDRGRSVIDLEYQAHRTQVLCWNR